MSVVGWEKNLRMPRGKECTKAQQIFQRAEKDNNRDAFESREINSWPAVDLF